VLDINYITADRFSVRIVELHAHLVLRTDGDVGFLPDGAVPKEQTAKATATATTMATAMAIAAGLVMLIVT
jgi:hypothetical protein